MNKQNNFLHGLDVKTLGIPALLGASLPFFTPAFHYPHQRRPFRNLDDGSLDPHSSGRSFWRIFLLPDGIRMVSDWK